MIDIDDNGYFDMFRIPGGEYGVKWKTGPIWAISDASIYGNLKRPRIKLQARLNNGNDVLKLLTITNVLKSLDVKLDLCVLYFPGARQDRITNVGEPLTVQVYADLINAQKYGYVEILDPHSDVTPALINHCVVRSVSTILTKLVLAKNYDTILIPDDGAAKKTFNYYFPDRNLHKNLNFVQCLKKRDTATGKLSGFKIVDEIKEGARCLIVDDICDGGGTFIGLAKEIINTIGTDEISLYVTHGIFSKGLDELKQYFDNIYTTNSIRPKQLDGVKSVSLEEL
jgi:ribose-phosphate pyrophosphokinase